MNIKTYIIFLFILSTTFYCQAQESELFNRLDNLLAKQKDLTTEKEKRIAVIKEGLHAGKITMEHEYAINARLYDEYIAFKYDSAYTYINRNIAIAKNLSDTHLYNESILKLVHILSVAGLFDQAESLAARIDTTKFEGEDLLNYYNVCSSMYQFNSEFTIGTVFFEQNNKKAQEYRKKLMKASDGKSFISVTNNATFIGEQGNPRQAIKMLEEYTKANLKSGERNYSIATSILAYFYSKIGDTTTQKHYLLLCAISDVEGCIRENNSLRQLASLLFDKGDLNHAYDYLSASIQDANFYGTRLRNMQASQLIPKIVQEYHRAENAQSKRLFIVLIITLVITIMMLIAIALMRNFLRKYRKANHKVHDINKELNKTLAQVEKANEIMHQHSQIKEQYIGRFMELVSVLINKAEERRKQANRLARDHRMEDLYTLIKSNELVAESSKLFYENFDEAFLNIYPDFVNKVNELLMPEERYVTKEKSLNTELRVLALIRLGINDNHKIASILRSSITTIYTYRSKIKAHSLYKNDFENRVTAIQR